MMMGTGDDKYDKLIKVLRESEPKPDSPEMINAEVFRQINNRTPGFSLTDLFNFLFGWIYIEWIRKGLIISSVLLVGFFVWQQRNIMNEIRNLNDQIILQNRVTRYNPGPALEMKLIMNRISDENEFQSWLNSKADFDNLIDSLINLRNRYNQILKFIEDDPELMKIVEKKLEEKTMGKINL